MNEVVLSQFNPYFINGAVVVFEEDSETELQRDNLVFQASSLDRYHNVQIEDQLDALAFRFYEGILLNPDKYWWLIADANEIINPLDLTDWIGKKILIPDPLSVGLV